MRKRRHCWLAKLSRIAASTFGVSPYMDATSGAGFSGTAGSAFSGRSTICTLRKAETKIGKKILFARLQSVTQIDAENKRAKGVKIFLVIKLQKLFLYFYDQ